MRRRAARTLPLYFVLVGFYALCNPRASILPLLTLSQNIWCALHRYDLPYWMAPTWSLAVEEQFYLILPLAILLIPSRRLPTVLVGLIISAPLFRVLTVLTVPDGVSAAYTLLPCRADALAIGILAAWAVRERQINRRSLWFATCILGGGFVVATIVDTDSTDLTAWLFGYTWVDLLSGILVTLLVTGKTVRWPRWLIAVGAISYPAYLFHLPVLVVICGIFGSGLAQTIVSIAVVFVVSALLHFIIEKPIHQWARRRWRYARVLVERGESFVVTASARN